MISAFVKVTSKLCGRFLQCYQFPLKKKKIERVRLKKILQRSLIHRAVPTTVIQLCKGFVLWRMKLRNSKKLTSSRLREGMCYGKALMNILSSILSFFPSTFRISCFLPTKLVVLCRTVAAVVVLSAVVKL